MLLLYFIETWKMQKTTDSLTHSHLYQFWRLCFFLFQIDHQFFLALRLEKLSWRLYARVCPVQYAYLVGQLQLLFFRTRFQLR